MGCGCRGNRNAGGAGRRNYGSVQEPPKVFSNNNTRTAAIVDAQLQAQALGITTSPSQMSAEKRKLEKLRRDAVRRALNK